MGSRGERAQILGATVVHDVEVGSEVRILVDGDLCLTRLFREGWQAQQFADEERKYRERGGE
jgi:hypothetical protein